MFLCVVEGIRCVSSSHLVTANHDRERQRFSESRHQDSNSARPEAEPTAQTIELPVFANFGVLEFLYV